MAKLSFEYELSQEAENDLEDIFDYTATKFGVDQAVSYVNDFEVVFNELSIHPQLGKERTEIRDGLRSIVKGSHIVFYLIMKNTVRIVRVLHKSRDVRSFIPPTNK